MCFFRKKKKDDGEKPSKFIKFELSWDKKAYYVCGYKEGYNEGKRLIIPPYYKGKPVVGRTSSPLGTPSGVVTVVFPDSFETIESWDFGNFVWEFEVSPNHPKYACVNGLITSKDGKTLLAIPGAMLTLYKYLTEDTSITVIDPEAFRKSRVYSVEVPACVEISGMPEDWLYKNTKIEKIAFVKDHPTWGVDNGLLYLKAGLAPTYKLIVNASKRVVFKSSVATRVFLPTHFKHDYDQKEYSKINYLIFEEGITEIDGDIGFYPNLIGIYLPKSLQKLSGRFLIRAKKNLTIVYPEHDRNKLLEHVETLHNEPNQSYNFIKFCKDLRWAPNVYGAEGSWLLPDNFPEEWR